ncbi:MAG: O-antigen ligase family protein [Bacteroidales bacterium]|nr:O-antigen ligase family protein [Bacteroidales bacterium]
MYRFTQIIKILAYACCAAFVFLMPFGWQSANYILGSFALFAVVNPDLWKNWKHYMFSFPEKAVVFVTLAYLVWEFVSMMWTDDTSYGMKRIVRHIPIFAMPFLAILARIGGVVKRPQVLIQFFCAGTLVSMFLCIYLSYCDSWYENPYGQMIFDYHLPGHRNHSLIATITSGYSYFSYSHLAHFVNPAYFSLFINILVIYAYVILYKFGFRKKVIAVSVSIVVFSAVYLVMLCNRANFISFALIIVVIGVYELVVKKHRMAALVIFSAIAIAICSVLSTGRGRDMVRKITMSVSVEQTDTTTEQDTVLTLGERKTNLAKANDRVSIWGSAFRVIKKYPVLGSGVGDSDDALIGQYYIDGKMELADRGSGTHNQFLDIWMGCGVPGIALMLAIVLIPLYYGVKFRNIGLILFASNMIVNLMFETMLNRSAGCFTLTFIMMLFILTEVRDKWLPADTH